MPALHTLQGKIFFAAALMLGGATLKKTSDNLNINIATAFAWRHKILDILKNKERGLRWSGLLRHFPYSAKF